MFNLVIAKFGREVGLETYRNLFDFMLDPKDIVRNGKLNYSVLLSWMSQFETALGFIEQAVFMTASESSEEYLRLKKGSCLRLVGQVQKAVESGGQLANGRRVSQEYLEKLRWKLSAYDEALARLAGHKRSLAGLVLDN